MKCIRRIFCATIVPLLLLSCSSSKNGLGDINNEKEEDKIIRFGIIADIQYCDCETYGSRYYRNVLHKLDECVDDLNKEEVQFTVNLGDLVDRDTPANIITLHPDKIELEGKGRTNSHVISFSSNNTVNLNQNNNIKQPELNARSYENIL